MIKLSAAQILEATGGTAIGLDGREEQVHATFATTDSREVETGTLFVAKPGAVTDGHKFVPTAFERGATLALVEREVVDEQGVPYPSIRVPDVVLAMGDLARYAIEQMRAQGELTVVGITGSAGKTTTKDLLAAIFTPEGPTVAPVGSYNSEVGVPLTVFRADESTRILYSLLPFKNGTRVFENPPMEWFMWNSTVSVGYFLVVTIGLAALAIAFNKSKMTRDE